ncbi:hypothetical protein P3TCK_05997 [Photobacterium profundum 3TCK]|jgi:hypothetical protein|uniref:Uncharacterized protein n=1 Tax=Photobacterium profundum 3TCK TaxID=314280 RepID=Q1Z742_9GAMM|nr:hypothetical protein P3TCK_05997 [Photobacterium profundum 3TCK]
MRCQYKRLGLIMLSHTAQQFMTSMKVLNRAVLRATNIIIAIILVIIN